MGPTYPRAYQRLIAWTVQGLEHIALLTWMAKNPCRPKDQQTNLIFAECAPPSERTSSSVTSLWLNPKKDTYRLSRHLPPVNLDVFDVFGGQVWVGVTFRKGQSIPYLTLVSPYINETSTHFHTQNISYFINLHYKNTINIIMNFHRTQLKILIMYRDTVRLNTMWIVRCTLVS